MLQDVLLLQNEGGIRAAVAIIRRLAAPNCKAYVIAQESLGHVVSEEMEGARCVAHMPAYVARLVVQEMRSVGPSGHWQSFLCRCVKFRPTRKHGAGSGEHLRVFVHARREPHHCHLGGLES
jgi:hypothetical protein